MTVSGIDENIGVTTLRPGDAEYETARRVWNGMIDRRPALIVRCATTEDVVEALSLSRRQGLPVAVRGGGHNVAGFATIDDGMVIDLGPMNDVHVDADRRVAMVGGGARWVDVDRETQAFGLATPGGVVSDTGVAGLTLGGGLGWLRGVHGLSCDNLIAAEVVLADGRVVQASAEDDAELLWGLRGGGGNFGVVTRFEFALHPVGPDVFFAFTFHDGRGQGMRDALRRFRDFCAETPDEIAPLGVCGVVPPGHEMFPPHLHGVPFFLVAALYAGPPEEGERMLAPLRSLGSPLVDFSGRMPYTEVQRSFDEDYPAVKLRYYWKSANLPVLDDAVIDRIVRHAKRQPSPLSTTDLWHIGGAVSRVAEDSAAFDGRAAGFMLNPEANWADPRQDEANIGWVRDFHDAVREFADGRAYLNFPGFHEDGEATLRRTFGRKYDRLLALKRAVDPENVFRSNQNIDPNLDG